MNHTTLPLHSLVSVVPRCHAWPGSEAEATTVAGCMWLDDEYAALLLARHEQLWIEGWCFGGATEQWKA